MVLPAVPKARTSTTSSVSAGVLRLDTRGLAMQEHFAVMVVLFKSQDAKNSTCSVPAQLQVLPPRFVDGDRGKFREIE